MIDFQTALTLFLTADPAHPVRTIVIAFLVGMLSAAIILLVHKTKGLGIAGLMVKVFAAMLMIIGGINFFLGIKWLVSGA